MEPGRALVTEFDDGKLMFCSFSHFAKFTPDYLREQLASSGFIQACEQAQGIAITSWSVYPYMTDCWKFLTEEALAGLTHRPRFFFDLADPASRSKTDLAGMIEALKGFERIGDVTLSVNGNEANQLAGVLGLDGADESPQRLQQLASALRDRIGIHEVSIHLIKGAATATAGECAYVAGPYCAKPKRSVGAGDRFNAGFFAAGALGMGAVERLQLASASSGFFVRNARSANWSELIRFVQDWAAGSFEIEGAHE